MILFKKFSKQKRMFTLAQVLIALGIIGVVGALTIPTLLTKINEKVRTNRVLAVENKFLSGLNLLNSQENGFNRNYENSEDFIKSLSKYLKISQICPNSRLEKCFPNYAITYNSKNGNSETIRVSELSSASALSLKNPDYTPPAGFIMSDGTPFIISYKNNCISPDSDKVLKSIPECVAGIYDIDGISGVNKFEYTLNKDGGRTHSGDVVGFGGARFGCGAIVNNVCITNSAFYSESIDGSTSMSSFYKGAKKGCEDIGAQLPSIEQLVSLARFFYDDSSLNGDRNRYDFDLYYSKNKPVAALVLNNDSYIRECVWNIEGNFTAIDEHTFYPRNSNCFGRFDYSIVKTICVDE